ITFCHARVFLNRPTVSTCSGWIGILSQHCLQEHFFCRSSVLSMGTILKRKNSPHRKPEKPKKNGEKEQKREEFPASAAREAKKERGKGAKKRRIPRIGSQRSQKRTGKRCKKRSIPRIGSQPIPKGAGKKRENGRIPRTGSPQSHASRKKGTKKHDSPASNPTPSSPPIIWQRFPLDEVTDLWYLSVTCEEKVFFF
ncbi:MAG: hypothetical protein IJ773_07310, partial [Lachnospiraceae bacterium]|nr:hypothetical protein [Lachnospiraceae bacterium]